MKHFKTNSQTAFMLRSNTCILSYCNEKCFRYPVLSSYTTFRNLSSRIFPSRIFFKKISHLFYYPMENASPTLVHYLFTSFGKLPQSNGRATFFNEHKHHRLLPFRHLVMSSRIPGPDYGPTDCHRPRQIT